MTDVQYWSFHPNHRTTLSHFFTKRPWNEENLLEKLQEWILRQIERLAKRENQPLFVSMDDPICQKTKPASRATCAIQGCDWHYSHNDHPSVWGHSLVWRMVYTRLYDKVAGRSKIDLAIERLLRSKKSGLGRCAWYPSQALIEACLKQGFHVIAMLKTNRILYPKGIAVQAKEFARYIEPNDTRLVTVGNERYRVYLTRNRFWWKWHIPSPRRPPHGWTR
ncbi:hypothetical protein GsuE55_19610 [Geobacillus subterraneus]|uniref:Transposase IS701-like DDE domain-containing protein n=1 Tax=Geobacillus subterraneus TaxID=129338 RepID=A0A679FL61_9BACL|nr:hypothetical protein GsuE55_19610 [Geobacillus subterraneus]